MPFSNAQLISLRGGWSADRRRTTTMVLQTIWTGGNAKLIGPHDACLAPSVPLLYDFFDIRESGVGSFDERQFCIDKQAHRPQEKRAWGLWWITLQYSTLNYQQKKRRLHPLQRPPTIASTHRQLTTIVTRDINGDPIVNSAGYFFDPPIEREDGRKILRISRNFADYDGGYGFENRVNNATFSSAPAYTLKVTVFDEEFHTEEFEDVGGNIEVEYWTRTVEMEHNPENWKLKLWDTGTRDKNGKDILINGVPVSEPVKLDGNGLAMDPQTGDAIALPDKQIFYTANFDAMGLLA